jgi:hypothetical protein
MADTTTDTKPPAKAQQGGKRFALIINNEARLRIIKLRGKISPASNTLVPGPQIDLAPGVNVVDAKLWTTWKDENGDVGEGDDMQRGARHALLVEPLPDDPAPGRRRERAGRPPLTEGPMVTSRATPLADLPPDQARALVPEILDPVLVDALLKTERRAVVAEALRQQQQRLNPRADNGRA